MTSASTILPTVAAFTYVGRGQACPDSTATRFEQSIVMAERKVCSAAVLVPRHLDEYGFVPTLLARSMRQSDPPLWCGL